MHSLMSSLDLLEHVVPVAAMAWAVVDVLDALPHPASARRNTGVSRSMVMAVRPMPAGASGLRFLISSVSFLVWRLTCHSFLDSLIEDEYDDRGDA